jgi:hypothetical protein
LCFLSIDQSPTFFQGIAAMATNMNASAAGFVPGTVHLVDLEGTMHAHHAQGTNRDIVLVPAPSSNPDDPLNWTPRRKLVSLACLCTYVVYILVEISS